MTDYLTKFKEGQLNDAELREFNKQWSKTAGNAPVKTFNNYIFLKTSRMVDFCNSCKLVSFAANLSPAYNGQQYYCKGCAEFYVECVECQTMILKADTKDRYHEHFVPLAPKKKKVQRVGVDQNGQQIVELVDAEEVPAPAPPNPMNIVHAYNADVMNNRMIHRTIREEQIVRRNQRLGLNSDPLRYFGIELEVEKADGCPPDIVAKVVAALGNDFVMVKHDGSLSDKGAGGFEIVSAPATREYHESGAWDGLFDRLGVFFQKSPDTTGLHFHVSKNNISQLTQGKMLLFINNKDNISFICDMADRDLSKPNPNGKFYAALNQNHKASEILTGKVHLADCPWHIKNKIVMNRYEMDAKNRIKFDPWGHPIIRTVIPDGLSKRPTCKCPGGRYTLDRYEALNVATKRETIEYRIFKGDFDKEKFFANLEFCDALIDFCAEYGPKDMIYTKFCDWLAKGHRGQFRNLTKKLIGREYINDPKLEPRMLTPDLESLYV